MSDFVSMMQDNAYAHSNEYYEELRGYESGLGIFQGNSPQFAHCAAKYETLLRRYGARTERSYEVLKTLAKQENRDIITTGNLMHLGNCTATRTVPTSCMEVDNMSRKDIKYTIDGVEYRATGSTYSDAVENAIKRHTEPPKPESPLFQEYAQTWFDLYYAPRLRGGKDGRGAKNQYGLFRNHLFPAFGAKQLHEITTDSLQTFYNGKVDESLAQSTIEKMHHLIKGVMDYALEQEIIQRNPAASRYLEIGGTKKERTVLTIAQTKILISRLDVLTPEDRLFVVIPLYTGLRRGEFLGLSWEDVDLNEEAPVLHVREGRNLLFDGNDPYLGPLKSPAAERSVGIVKPLWELLNQRPKKRGHVIRTEAPMITDRCYRRTWERIERKLELGVHFTAHSLRHTFATLLESSVSTKELQHIMGHSDSQTTLNTYVHRQPEQVERARVAADNVFVQLFSVNPHVCPQSAQVASA